jgi:hypothetical protein
MIIEDAKPVAARAELIAHFSFSAVIRTLAATIGNASANVSSIATPFNHNSPRT